MAEHSVECYNTTGPTLLHQSCMVQLLKEGLAEELGDYSRSLCGGMSEESSSTIEIPDIDINARFHLNSDCIEITKAEKYGSFLYEIKVVESKKEEVDELVLKMQYHGVEDEPQQKDKLEKSLAKSYVVRKEGTFLSSNVARWQLVGVIKAMQSWGLEVTESSRMAADVGLSNGVYNVMIYDSAVCRRGILKKGRLEKVLKVMLEQKPHAERATLQGIMDLALCFFPETGIQVDYTAGFHVSEDAVPDEAKKWTRREGEWPSGGLINKVMAKGAHLVPKTFTEEKKKKNDKSRRWRINFDLNVIITDKEYSPNVDANRVLIILKDIKNAILPAYTPLVKSYFLKVAIARYFLLTNLLLQWNNFYISRAMLKNQESRKSMSTTDLLLASLLELQHAYEKMRLPDFFNSKFNHLQRYKEKKYEASKIGEKIADILNDLSSILEKLGTTQEVFKEEQEKRMAHALREVSSINGRDTQEWVLKLRRLNLGLSCTSLTQVIMWMEAKRRAAGGMILDHRRFTKRTNEWGTWERQLRLKYLDFFSKPDLLLEDTKRQTSQDKLSSEIIENFIERHQTHETALTKLQLWEELANLLEDTLEVRLVPFGSSFTMLGLEGCDLDMMVCPKTDNLVDKLELLEKVIELFKRNGIMRGEATLVRSARTPVLKLTHEGTGLDVDLVVELREPLALRNAHLFLHMALLDWRVRPFVLALRCWAEGHRVNSTLEHSLSSHALTIIALHYLQWKICPQPAYQYQYLEYTPTVLPNLMRDYPQIFSPDIFLSNLQFGVTIPWQSQNRTSIGELFKVLVQDPYRKWNAARAVTSAKHWKKIQTELKHSVQRISTQPDVGFKQLCEKGAEEVDQEEDELNLDGLTMDQLIARLRT